MSFLSVGYGNRFAFSPSTGENYGSHQCAHWWLELSTGQFHCDRFDSLSTPKRRTPWRVSFFLEQGTGIEPAFTAWEAVVLPIYEPCIQLPTLYQTSLEISTLFCRLTPAKPPIIQHFLPFHLKLLYFPTKIRLQTANYICFFLLDMICFL